MTTMYDLAREEYAALGIDTEAVMEKLAAKPISVHCWHCLLYTSDAADE